VLGEGRKRRLGSGFGNEARHSPCRGPAPAAAGRLPSGLLSGFEQGAIVRPTARAAAELRCVEQARSSCHPSGGWRSGGLEVTRNLLAAGDFPIGAGAGQPHNLQIKRCGPRRKPRSPVQSSNTR